MLGLEEFPLNTRSTWKSDGKFILKQVGSDPSWRARLAVSNRDRKASKNTTTKNNYKHWQASQFLKSESDEIKEEEEKDDEDHNADKFLVCIFNISSTVAHAIFHVC